MAKGQGLVNGDRVMDTLIKQKATIIKPIQSAILPTWTVAYMIRYDEAPAMEYNMGTIEGMQFSKYLKKLKTKTKLPS